MTTPFILDIGGEGRHPAAWNLNPCLHRTIGSRRGQPIPRLILGRGESIPLPNRSVDVVIAERVPLRVATLSEIRRVAKAGATIILRHALVTWFDPHRLVPTQLPGRTDRAVVKIGDQPLLETIVKFDESAQLPL